MIPAVYDLKIYAGDTFYGPLITLPNLTPFGGPPDLTDCFLSAQIRDTRQPTGTLLADMDIDVVDDTERIIRPTLSPEVTSDMAKGGFWDLQVEWGPWVGTPLRGAVTLETGPTEP